MYNPRMKIINLNQVDSTHKYLKEYLLENGYTQPICIVTTLQTDGIGSRGNEWNGKKGNLFFSFVINKNELAEDLPLQSASIYFSFILKQVLKDLGSKLWLKWPNDFYVDEKKIGGTITTLKNDLLLCGIGLNLIEVSKEFGYLDIEVDINHLLIDYFKKLTNRPLWQDILKEYVIEFKRSEKFHVTLQNKKVSLKDATLNSDGSIQINDKKVFSLR